MDGILNEPVTDSGSLHGGGSGSRTRTGYAQTAFKAAAGADRLAPPS